MNTERCPYCQAGEAKSVGFTAWGGFIGPRLLSLVKCRGCGGQYNGKNGRRVERAIRMYTLATLAVLAIVAAGVIYAYTGPRTDGGADRGRTPIRSIVS